MVDTGPVQSSGLTEGPALKEVPDLPEAWTVNVQEAAPLQQGENPIAPGGSDGREFARGLPTLGSGVVVDVGELERQAAKDGQPGPVPSTSGRNPPDVPRPPATLRRQVSLPKPRCILKGANAGVPRKSSLDLSAPPTTGVRRAGSLPSAVMELTAQGVDRESTGKSGPPMEGPPSISRLVHAASWDVGTQLPLQPEEAAVAPAEVDLGQPREAVPSGGSREEESAHLSLLGAAPLSGAQLDVPRRSLQRQVSFSPAVAGPHADEPPLWPMHSLRRSLSRALSWGKDRMNSGWSSYSNVEFCRICHTVGAEEPLIDIGCDCRDGLNLAHRSCITQWFTSRGTNMCEICKSEAANIPAPPPLPPRHAPVRSAPLVRVPPPPASRTAVVGRVPQLLMWAVVGGMLLASILVIIVTRRAANRDRP